MRGDEDNIHRFYNLSDTVGNIGIGVFCEFTAYIRGIMLCQDLKHSGKDV